MASPKWKVYLIVFPTVTPAKAGVQGNKRALASLDPGFRRDDEEKREARTPADSLQKQAGRRRRYRMTSSCSGGEAEEGR